jgi:lipid A 3-O-deacylase
VTPAALVLLAVVGAAPAAPREAPPRPRATLDVSAGAFEVAHPGERAAEVGVKYRGSGHFWLARPLVGAMATTDGAFHFFVGFSIDVPLGKGPLVRGGFAPGYFSPGGGKDLGYGLEFRSSLEIGWRFGTEWGLGIEWYHLSNARLGRINPGDASLLLTVTLPIGRRSGRAAAETP